MSLYYDGKGSDECLGGCYIFGHPELTAQKNVGGGKRDIIFSLCHQP